MKRILALGLALAMIACSEPPPPPKPQAKAPEPVPVPIAPKPEVKPEPPKPDPNKELAARVKSALEAPDAKLPSGADGKVSLWGAVATAGQRSRAAQLASKIDGVKSVDNQLKVVKGS